MEIRERPDGIEFWVHVRPRARNEVVGGCFDGALAVSVRAVPTDGKANAPVLAAIARALGLRRRAVALVSGASARRKRLAATGPPEALRARIEGLAAN